MVADRTTFSHTLHQTLQDGDNLDSSFGVYTTSKDVPPRWPSNDCVEQGVVKTTFASGDTSMAEERWNSKLRKKVRSFTYEVHAVITEGSCLSFDTKAYGRKAGSATFDVDLG